MVVNFGPLTRRALLHRGLAAASTLALPLEAAGAATGAPRTTRAAVTPLPTGPEVRAEIKQMVDLGPRYTGTAGHAKYIDWLEQELTAAGVVMLPRDDFPLEIWEARSHGLELLSGAHAGAVHIPAYYPRSQETGAAGVTGPLVYAGAAPAPELNGDVSQLPAAATRYPGDLASWAAGLSGTLGGSTQGAIVLVDLPMPEALTAGAFLGIATYLNWDGHTEADWAVSDYKRPWIAPGVSGVPTSPFQQLGAIGVIFILDAPADALEGIYAPFENAFEPLPALFVDRDTGAALRTAAAERPAARLTLDATRRAGTSPALLGYLPASKPTTEALFVNTHTDGEGFVEENGGVGLVALARHFGSLRGADRLQRALVFSLWPGHMASGMPQLGGVLAKHPELVSSAVAGITVEHLGCSEWIDTAEQGYHATGEAELLGVWTTQGKVFDLTRDATVAHDIPRAALLRPPVQFGVGGALQSSGVPQVGFLAGPYYLLNDTKAGDLDKLDDALAAKQIAWVADILWRMDGLSAADLAAGDPTLGSKPSAAPFHFPALSEAPAGVASFVLHAGRASTRATAGSVTLGRAGTVRVQATLVHSRTRIPLGNVLLHFAGAGSVRFTLRYTHRGRAAVHRLPHGRVELTARTREPGGALRVRRARPTTSSSSRPA